MPPGLPKSFLPLVFGLLLPLLPAFAAPHPIHRQDTTRFDPPPDPLLREHALETWIKQQQSQLDDRGVHVFASYWGDFLANPIGGKAQSAAWTQLLVVGADVDLNKTLGWTGGSFVVSMMDVAGSNLSSDIGNLFAVPQAFLLNTCALYDLYLKQDLLDGRISLSIGRMTAGQYFATLPAMVMVVSAAVNGNPTSLFVNALFPSISSGTWGAYAKFKPAKEIYAEAGIFQASPRNGMPAYHGADFSIRRGDGIILMAETGWTPDFILGETTPTDGKTTKPEPLHLPGIYNFGAYLTNYPYAKFQGGGVERNAYGFYGLAQQMVWRNRANPQQCLSLWGGVTYSPQDQIALLPVMGMGGAIFQGLIPTRNADNTLLSFYSGSFSRSFGDALAGGGEPRPTVETVLEASYIIQITPALQIQPDVQYVIRPSGVDTIPNALVIGGQVSVSF